MKGDSSGPIGISNQLTKAHTTQGRVTIVNELNI